MSEGLTEGWGQPLNARKPHYFRNGISLCGAWMFYGDLFRENGKPEDCRACTRHVEPKLGRSTR